MIKKSQENYLRAMYELSERQADKKAGIKKAQVAEMLQISKSSVTQMMKKLLERGLIKMDFYSRIFFTKKGLALAERVTRKHRIIEVFLRDVLGFESLEEINEEAKRLEYGFSDNVIMRLNNFLGNPKECPHGEVISD